MFSKTQRVYFLGSFSNILTIVLKNYKIKLNFALMISLSFGTKFVSRESKLVFAEATDLRTRKVKCGKLDVSAYFICLIGSVD